jgi:hypothetical protein
MTRWTVEIGDEFEPEFNELHEDVRTEVLALSRVLQWRVAFAFDPKRKAILLVAGDKSGVSEKKFYRQLIAKADDRFDAHLDRQRKKERT